MPAECHPNLVSLLLMGSLKQCPPGMNEAIKVRSEMEEKGARKRKGKNEGSNG